MEDKKTTIFLVLFALVVTFGIITILIKPSTELAPSEKASTSKPTAYVNVTADELKKYVDNDKDIYLLDVHIPEQEHITGTDEFIPFNELAEYKSRLPENKDAEIVVYCRSGSMSKTASQELIDMGYTNVKNLSGGINAWKTKGYSS